MARTKLAIEAVEKSTYVLTLTFTDAEGASVSPSAVTWTLTDVAGVVINARADVVVTPSGSVTIVLSGDDLALQAGERNAAMRLITLKAIYSSTEGAGLPLHDEYEFKLRGLAAVS